MRRFLARCLVLACAVSVLGCSKRRYKVPSSAMYPTIPLNTSVMADARVTVPARGDVFVFKYPEHPEQSFVKRIVALPGDRVEMKGRVLSINGRALPTCTIGYATYTDAESSHGGDLVLESNGAAAYIVFYENLGQDGSWTVKPGEYFAVGDNRNNSHDSRRWFTMGGGVPADHLQGKVDPPKLALPKDAAALEPALAKCKRELGV